MFKLQQFPFFLLFLFILRWFPNKLWNFCTGGLYYFEKWYIGFLIKCWLAILFRQFDVRLKEHSRKLLRRKLRRCLVFGFASILLSRESELGMVKLIFDAEFQINIGRSSQSRFNLLQKHDQTFHRIYSFEVLRSTIYLLLRRVCGSTDFWGSIIVK